MDKKQKEFSVFFLRFLFCLDECLRPACRRSAIDTEKLLPQLCSCNLCISHLKRDQIPFRWQKGNLKFLFLRSIAGTLGILCNFYAVDHLVLSDASMLNKMSPFFAVLFSFLFLKERCTPVQVFGVTGAFIGSLLS